MKLHLIFLLSLFVSTTSPFLSGLDIPQTGVSDEIISAIKDGHSNALAKYFNNTLDLTVPGNESTYSRAQAEIIIKDFFSKFPPKSFKINHQGSAKDGSLFFIGTYISTNSKSFRTYFLIKKVNEKYLIQQLQFESE